MKKTRIIVREKISNITTDEGLCALNGIYYSPYEEFDDTTEDEDILGTGKYTYYTLDWEWPYESGNDEYDTWLGNTALEQDLELTIVIHTLATASSDRDNPNGITPPKTGDVNPVSILIVAGVVSLGAMLLLWVDDRREKKCARK